MKYFIYFLMLTAVALIVFNTTMLDFDNLLEGDSSTALIGILSSVCVIVLMLILLISKKIEKKSEE
ncbi:MAG TPA: hypothetical protein VFM70_06715 [Salinimicrobium sp.]|nr:hypothetical protein [Salinimicrobium sp.]